MALEAEVKREADFNASLGGDDFGLEVLGKVRNEQITRKCMRRLQRLSVPQRNLDEVIMVMRLNAVKAGHVYQ